MKIPSLALLALSVVGCDTVMVANRGRFYACREALARSQTDSARLATLLSAVPGHPMSSNCSAYLGTPSQYDSLVRQLDSLNLTLNVKRGVLNTLEDTTFHRAKP